MQRVVEPEGGSDVKLMKGLVLALFESFERVVITSGSIKEEANLVYAQCEDELVRWEMGAANG